MLKNKRFLIAASLICIFCSVGAQTTSPYSRYGYGVLKDKATGVSKGMGGVSYGIRNSINPNAANPASYSGVDSLTFLFDFAVYFDAAKLSDPSGSRTDYNGGLDYITLLFPVAKNFGISAGILPVSSVGYKFGSDHTLNGIDYSRKYEGDDGFSEVYLGLGYKLPFIKGLSLGLNFEYIFGKLKHNNSIDQIANIGAGASIATGTKRTTEFRLNSYGFDIGLQYELPIDKYNEITFGAVYSPQINSTGTFKEYTLETIQGTENALSADTVHLSKQDAGMPHKLGFGAVWNHKNKWLVGTDLSFENWKKVKYTKAMVDGLNAGDRFNNKFGFKVGAEFTADRYSRSFINRVKFRGGFNYSNSYINVKSPTGATKGFDEYGATIGFGIPIYDRESFGARTSYVNLNFEYKRISPRIKGMVKEQYFGISLGVSLNELWFYKNKIR